MMILDARRGLFESGCEVFINQEALSQIDEVVLHIVESAHQAAIQILETNRDLLEETAQHLLKQEVLEGQTLYGYLSKAETPPGIDVWLKTGEFETATA